MSEFDDDLTVPFRITKSIGERSGVRTYGVEVFDDNAPKFALFTVATSDPGELDRAYKQVQQLVLRNYKQANADILGRLSNTTEEPPAQHSPDRFRPCISP